MRVALIGAGPGDLHAALTAAGHDVQVLAPRPVGAAEAVLRRRGFTDGLTRQPALLAALVRGRFDLAHAFSATDALAALAWRRIAGGAVVFTCTEVLDRSRVADRRGRLHALTSALERSDATTAASEQASAALARWMALDAPVLDGAAHERLYRELLARG